jgi:hypothetical protein
MQSAKFNFCRYPLNFRLLFAGFPSVVFEMARLTKSERKVLGKILAKARAAKKRKARSGK